MKIKKISLALAALAVMPLYPEWTLPDWAKNKWTLTSKTFIASWAGMVSTRQRALEDMPEAYNYFYRLEATDESGNSVLAYHNINSDVDANQRLIMQKEELDGCFSRNTKTQQNLILKRNDKKCAELHTLLREWRESSEGEAIKKQLPAKERNRNFRVQIHKDVKKNETEIIGKYDNWDRTGPVELRNTYSTNNANQIDDTATCLATFMKLLNAMRNNKISF